MYKGYYIQGSVDGNVETITVSASPSGYGHTWCKRGLKTLHSAKLAISRHIKEHPNQYNVDEFTRGYAECAIWSSTEGEEGTPIDQNYDLDDIAPETWQEFVSDCADFQKSNRALLRKYCDQYKPAQDFNVWACAGHDFWLTRNGHGAGFWDRGLGEIGKKLSESAKIYGEVWLYIGDDGKVYQG
jgi:hypothetical protein